MSTVGAVAPGIASAPRDVGRRTIAAELHGLQHLHDRLDDSFDEAAEALTGLQGKVITLGVGKSGHVAEKVAATLRSVGLPALHMNASDSLHGDLGVVGLGDIALLFSKSGTTRELMVLLPHLRARGVNLIAIVGSLSSPLARECEIALDASVEREGCPLGIAPMASVLVALAVGDALAAAVMSARGFTTDDFARLHPAGAVGARLTLTVGDVMSRGVDLALVDAGATLKDAVLEITRTASGAVCVVDAGQRLVGFVTDGDIRRQLLKVDSLAAVNVADVMTESPVTVRPDLPLSQALVALEERPKELMTAPVVEDGRCVGLLRLHDAVQAHLR